MTPLLERERELRAADALLADARDDRGRLLVLEAGPGFGKSTLIEHVVARAEDFNVLRAAGRELERGLGWGVARSLFEPVADEPLLRGPAAAAGALFGAAADVEGRSPADLSFAILHGLYWLAVRLAEETPVLLVVDDAQWADEPSLRFLAYLQGRLRDQPIAVVVAARTGEPGEGGLLAPLLADRDATVCELGPLGPGAVAELIRDAVPAADDDLCRRCAALTAGHPLGVRELVWAIAAGEAVDLDASAERAARSLSRSVLHRLRALGTDAGALAEAVAVFEGGVALHQAAALAELSPGDVLGAADELARTHILEPDDPLEFTHPLLRSAVYGSLSRRRKADLHRRAAALLITARAPSEQVAGHLLHALPAGDVAVVDALRGAARHALAAGVAASAVAYLERALHEPPADVVRVDVLAELGRAEATAAPWRAIEHFEAAIEATAEPGRRAALALELGRAMHDAARPEDACRAFERGLAEGDGELALELEAWYLTSAVLLPERAADAHRRVEAILAHGAREATPAVRALMSKALVMRMYAGEPHEGLVALARELYADGRLLTEGGIASQAVGHVAGALSYCDEYAAGEEVLGRALEATRRVGWVTMVGAVSMLRARQRNWTGPIPSAIEDAGTAVELFSNGMQLYLPAAAHCLIRALLERDEPGEAEELYTRVARETSPTGMFAAWQHESRARLAAHRGDHAIALKAFLACGQELGGLLVVNPSMYHWRSEAGLSALRLGQRDLAERLIGEETALAERLGAPRALGVARRAAALLERGQMLEDGLRSAAAWFAGCGARVEHVHTLVELGGAIRRNGRAADARDILREALRQAEAIGALKAARLARDELGLAGGRAPARRDGSGQLSPSELRVAGLAAAGRTNRQIADELYVTVKAVEWHLSNSYRKLDIRGRDGLAAALAEH